MEHHASRRALVAVAAALLVVLTPALDGAWAATGKRSAPRRRPAPPPELVWHAETLDGQAVASSQADRPINPASIVKVATSWWALRQLGPDHRFETRIFARGRIDPRQGVLHGDLVVAGGGDPDFQTENALLVARALNRAGIRRVTGALVVDPLFWIGWENGSGGTLSDPKQRGVKMAARLRRAFDPSKWGQGEQTAWRGLSSRGVDAGPRPPRIVVLGGARFEPDAAIQGSAPLIVHRSKPLKDVLRRFNCFSNNDIERIGSLLGSPADLRALLAATVGQGDPGLRVATTSGLGENRLTLRQIVALMREFRATAGALGLDVEGLLPVSGCDPGTVTASFPRLALGESYGSVVGKTGTLTATDGGIVALAGFANTTAGDIVFAVAAPKAGGRLRAARGAEEAWLLDLIARHGGPRPRACAPPLAGPEAGAVILDGSASYASATPGAPAGDPRDGGHAR